MTCSWFDAVCNVVEGASNSALEAIASAVLEAQGLAFASIGTIWVHIGTPNVTNAPGEVTAAKPVGAFGAPVLMVMGWTMWISLIVMVMTLLILAAMMAVRHRNGEPMMMLGRMGLVLGGVFIISGASALVAGLLPAGPIGVGGAVAVLQSSLWWLMLAVGGASLMVGAVRMVWQMRGEAVREMLGGLIRLVVVVTAGAGFVGMCVLAGDEFAKWILGIATECDLSGDNGCFGRTLSGMMLWAVGNPLGTIVIIVLGLCAFIGAIGQIILMLVRSGMIVVLTGIFPMSAAVAAGGSKMGEQWYQKNIAWLVAFVLYKPAAAIVYSAAFLMAGADLFKDDGTGIVSIAAGLIMMLLALVALPALMRFVTPMVGMMAAGAGGGMAGAAAGVVASGAVNAGRMMSSGGGSGGSSGGADGDSGPSGATNSGSPGSTGSGGQDSAAASGAESAGASAGGSGAASAGGTAAGGAAAGGAAAGGAAAGGAAAGGAAAGGAAAGASAGAAGGPVGMAAGAALGAIKEGVDAAKGAAQGAVQETTGEES